MNTDKPSVEAERARNRVGVMKHKDTTEKTIGIFSDPSLIMTGRTTDKDWPRITRMNTDQEGRQMEGTMRNDMAG
jgi:hypothetical protein